MDNLTDEDSIHNDNDYDYDYDDYMLSEDDENALHSSEFEFEKDSDTDTDTAPERGLDDSMATKYDGDVIEKEEEKKTLVADRWCMTQTICHCHSHNHTCCSTVTGSTTEQGRRILSDDIKFHNSLKEGRDLLERREYFAARELYTNMSTDLRDCYTENNCFEMERIVLLDDKILELWADWLESSNDDNFDGTGYTDNIGLISRFYAEDIAAVLRDIVRISASADDTSQITGISDLLKDLTQFLPLFRQYALKTEGGTVPLLFEFEGNDDVSENRLRYLQRIVLFHKTFLARVINALQEEYINIPSSISDIFDILMIQHEVTSTWSSMLASKLKLLLENFSTLPEKSKTLSSSFILHHNGSSLDISLEANFHNLSTTVSSSPRSLVSSLLMEKVNLLLQIFIFNFFSNCGLDRSNKDYNDTCASLGQYGRLFDLLSKFEQTSISFQKNSKLMFLLHFCKAIYHLPRMASGTTSYHPDPSRYENISELPLLPYLDMIELCRTEILTTLQRMEEIGWYEGKGRILTVTATATTKATATTSQGVYQQNELKFYHKFLLLGFILTSMVLVKMNKLDIDPFEFEPVKVVIETSPYMEALKNIYSKFINFDFGAMYTCLFGPQFSNSAVPYLKGLINSVICLSRYLKLWRDIAPKYSCIAVSDVIEMLSFTDQLPQVTRDDIITLLMRSAILSDNGDIPEFKLDLTKDQIYFGDATSETQPPTPTPPRPLLLQCQTKGGKDGRTTQEEANLEYFKDVRLLSLPTTSPLSGLLSGSLCPKKDDDLAVFFTELKNFREQQTSSSSMNMYNEEWRDGNRDAFGSAKNYYHQGNHDEPHFSAGTRLGDPMHKRFFRETNAVKTSRASPETGSNVQRNDDTTTNRIYVNSNSRHLLLAQKYRELVHLVSDSVADGERKSKKE